MVRKTQTWVLIFFLQEDKGVGSMVLYGQARRVLLSALKMRDFKNCSTIIKSAFIPLFIFSTKKTYTQSWPSSFSRRPQIEIRDKRHDKEGSKSRILLIINQRTNYFRAGIFFQSISLFLHMKYSLVYVSN